MRATSFSVISARRPDRSAQIINRVEGLAAREARSLLVGIWFHIKVFMSAEKILVVDDSPVVVKALEMKLAAAGFQVATAADGSGALAAVRRERPDLIVLDINFPPDVGHGGGVAWDGFLIMQWLGRIEEAKDIPIVVITGDKSEDFRNQATKSGARAYFTKPVDPNALIETIRQILPGTPNPTAD